MTREDDGGAAPLSSLLGSVKAARNHDKPTLEQAQVLPHDNSAASGSFLPSHLRLGEIFVLHSVTLSYSFLILFILPFCLD